MSLSYPSLIASKIAPDEPERYRRCRLLYISDVFLSHIFCNGVHDAFEVIQDGLPKDARIVQARVWNYRIELLVESAEFGPVLIGDPIPEIRPMMRSIDSVHAGGLKPRDD